MLNEDLLKTRYKVISDYPNSQFKVGDILAEGKVNGDITFRRTSGEDHWGGQSIGVPCIKHPQNYPANFKKLEWWEDRAYEDMPKYVKNMSNVPEVRKVIEYRLDRFYEVLVTLLIPFGHHDREYLLLEDTLPATLEEYEAYLLIN